jgi:hypothetical protein
LENADLSEDVRATALKRLDLLPDLYQGLEKTCESRFLDDILRHVQIMFRFMDAPKSVERMTLQLLAMHELHGIPPLGLKQPVVLANKSIRQTKAISVN